MKTKEQRSRAVLTKEQAIEIFKLRFACKIQVSAPRVAQHYCVNEKTIRDIWKGRTWTKETLQRSFSNRPPGRPLGSKNKKLEKKIPLPVPFGPNSNGHNSVDAQLYEWDQGKACLTDCEDPFRAEWNLCSRHCSRAESDFASVAAGDLKSEEHSFRTFGPSV